MLRTNSVDTMPRVAIVVNPSKVKDLEGDRKQAETLCAEHGWDAPEWIETTVDDPGHAMTKQALDSGVDIIGAVGGDGTVRAVASEVRGSGVPLGIIAYGTGNLLARNLDLPLNTITGGLTNALTGVDHAIDVGIVTFDDRDPEPFLVITGVGVDADTMANTNENLKKLVGWFAYVSAGQKALLQRGFRVRASNDGPGPDGRSHRARSYMVCNCGVLTGGVVLVPEAEPDDGHLDTLILSPRGPLGWGAVITDVVTRHRRGHQMVRHWTGHESDATFSRRVEGQIDGDPMGTVRRMRTSVEKGNLVVRVSPEYAAQRDAHHADVEEKM